MATDQEVGSQNIRSQVFNKTVKGFAEAMYKFKQVVTVESTAGWKNYFYRENPTALSAGGADSVKGVPRGSSYPQAYETWDRIQTVVQKYGLESVIPWEDLISDDVDVRQRTLFRIAEGVAKAVDDQIWIDLGGTGTLSAVTSFTLVGREWDLASATIIDDLMRAKTLIAQNNYDTTNLVALISPRDHRSIINYLASKGAQFPTIGSSVAMNGEMGNLAGIKLIVSNSVTASNALIVVPKICATWKELQSLTTTTIEDPYKSLTVRSAEVGVLQLTDPNAVIRIFGTQSSSA